MVSRAEHPEPLPVPDGAQHFIAASYPATGMRVRQLRDLIAMLDEAGVLDEAVLYVYGTVNRSTQMTTFRVDLDDPDWMNNLPGMS